MTTLRAKDEGTAPEYCHGGDSVNAPTCPCSDCADDEEELEVAMDSLHTEKMSDGTWMASIVGTTITGLGATELDAVKSLARGLRNRLQEIRDLTERG
jgi:hypothetical protein